MLANSNSRRNAGSSFETERAVRTPSSEQVRRPVYREGLEQWRHFSAHLDPLRKALGPVLERYPAD
ncbi:MAG: hypothetical protein U5K76_15475 [Woeseiaceae bacterium]|nr:hypothetical protein [Woeseiaceae bacterium]